MCSDEIKACLKLLAYASTLSLVILMAVFVHGSSYELTAQHETSMLTPVAPPATLQIWNPDLHSSNITSPTRFPIGSEFSVRVNLTTPGPIAGFDVTLNYVVVTGPSILQAVKTGNELSGGLFDPANPPAGCHVLVARSLFDIPPGWIRFAVVMAGGCTASGTGMLFTILFRVTGLGATFINIAKTDANGRTVTRIVNGPPTFAEIPFQSFDARFQNVPGIPPIAQFTYEPGFPVKGTNVMFAGVQSYDPDNSTLPGKGIRKYLWLFGDWTINVEGVNQTHEFTGLLFVPLSGNFTVTLIVWDYDNNLPGLISQVVNVGPGIAHFASYNWSGYAISGTPGTVTDVKGSWVVPGIVGECGTAEQHSAFWVGIDGFNSQTVEQIGTDSACINGAPSYFAWYEFYPQPSRQIHKMKLQPGDSVYAEVTFSPESVDSSHLGPGDKSANDSSGRFTVTLIDKTSGTIFTKIAEVKPLPQLSSAEWIAEAPSGANGTLPLANFGTVRFGQDTTGSSGTCFATVSNVTGPIGSFGSHTVLITMIAGDYTVKAATSALSPDLSSFFVRWESTGP